MKSILRILFLFCLLGGIALVVIPWYAANVIERPIGTWPVYSGVSGPLPAHVDLKPEDAPLAVFLDMTTVGPASFGEDRAPLTLTVTDPDNKTVLADTLTFVGVAGRDTNPQTAEKVFSNRAGAIPTLASGTYVFTVDAGDSEDVTIKSVALLLKHEAGVHDPRMQPVGFLLMAVGFIGLALSFGRETPANPNSQPPPPRWGRPGKP